MIGFTKVVLSRQPNIAIFFREEKNLEPAALAKINTLRKQFDHVLSKLLAEGVAAGEFVYMTCTWRPWGSAEWFRGRTLGIAPLGDSSWMSCRSGWRSSHCGWWEGDDPIASARYVADRCSGCGASWLDCRTRLWSTSAGTDLADPAYTNASA